MTTEEKQLVMVDLYARLPYGVKAHYIVHNVVEDTYDEWDAEINEATDFIEGCKLYLRSMSSMTKEEKLHLELEYGFEFHDDVLSNLHIIKSGGYYEREGDYVEPTEYREYKHISITTVLELIKWLNEHHFDYRGLIEKGLALEAPKDMYKF